MLVRSVSITQHRNYTPTFKKRKRAQTWDTRERQRLQAQRQRQRILEDIKYLYTPLHLTSKDNIEEEEQQSPVKVVPSLYHCQRVRIRVQGSLYETWEATLEVFPTTLLGQPKERSRYYDEARDEYVFDRCCISFDAILFYYQSCGILAKPANVKRKRFLEEMAFFQIYVPLDKREENEQRYEEKELSKRIHSMPQSCLQELLWRKLLFKDNSLYHNASYFVYCSILFLSVVSTTFEPTHASRILWFIVEIFLGIIYTLEYVLRIYVSGNPKSYITSAMGVIDLVSMTATQAYVILHHYRTPVTPFVKFILVFRILKCTRVCRGIFELLNVLWVCKEYIVLFVGTALSCCVATAALVQHEEEQNHKASLQPHGFDYFTWLWYAVITVTGVGYGDYYPHTTVGRILGGFLSVCGMLLFCMAATQMVYRFVDVYYMPDVLGYTSKGRKRDMITKIRDEFLQDAEESRGGY